MKIDDYLWKALSIPLIAIGMAATFYGVPTNQATFVVTGLALSFGGFAIEITRAALARKGVRAGLSAAVGLVDRGRMHVNEYNGVAISERTGEVAVVLRERRGGIQSVTVPFAQIAGATVVASTRQIVESSREASAKGIMAGLMVGGPVGAMLDGMLYSKAKRETKDVYDKAYLMITRAEPEPQRISVYFGSLGNRQAFNDVSQHYHYKDADTMARQIKKLIAGKPA